MQPDTLRKLARAWIVLTAIMAVGAIAAAIVLEIGPDYDAGESGETAVFTLAFSLVYCTVGGFIALNRPANLVGWSMMFSGSGVIAGGLLSAYADYVLLAHPGTDAPLALEAHSLSGASWTFLMSGIFFLLLLFPGGRPASPRWELLGKIVGVGFILIWFTLTTAPTDYDSPFDQFGRNRLAFHDFEPMVAAVFPLVFLCLLAVAGTGIHLFIRFLRSRGLEREQFKWLAISAVPFTVSIPFNDGLGIVSDVSLVAFGFGLFALPVSVGIAILRYHLYDIDRILNRTLVYGSLTAGLAAVYFASVVALQAGLQEWNGGNDLAIAVTTLFVAALFLPARRRIQSAVDRRFNRRAYDAARTIDAFSTRLREEVDLDTLRYELLTVVDETMQPRRASLWLRGNAR